MKERMEQMSHWCHQVISESDEEQEAAAATDTKPNQVIGIFQILVQIDWILIDLIGIFKIMVQIN